MRVFYILLILTWQETLAKKRHYSTTPSPGEKNYNAIPQMSQQNPPNPFSYQGQIPQSYSGLSQALARQQSEVAQYSSKQMEYLDQQRRYQQAMIDHQAGAAVLTARARGVKTQGPPESKHTSNLYKLEFSLYIQRSKKMYGNPKVIKKTFGTLVKWVCILI
uniref:Uncharacterized protein n=1 Tax=Heterorhabditis bacteriophora TaxID=37862 RepID=A0A1I7WKZ1_HETBA